MKVLRNLFQSQLERLIAVDNYLGLRQFQKLFRQLKSAQAHHKLVKCLQTDTENSFQIIKILSVANILLLYSKNYFSVIEDHLTRKQGSDDWLKDKFIIPYHTFIIRCCLSKDNYIACRCLKIRKQDALKTLFYSINMLKLLFQVVAKMPFLGRYYKQKHSDPSVSMAMQIIALQAQKLYRAFEFMLQDILRLKDLYVKTIEDQFMMRGIFIDQLSSINQQMTKLFLDKYYAPITKGIQLKLFRPDERGLDFQRFFSGINLYNKKKREARRSEIQKTLFPKVGQVNWTFYQETLLSSSTASHKTSQAQDYNYNQCNLLNFSQHNQKQNNLLVMQKLYKSGHSAGLKKEV